jgi:hypothetical protein
VSEREEYADSVPPGRPPPLAVTPGPNVGLTALLAPVARVGCLDLLEFHIGE